MPKKICAQLMCFAYRRVDFRTFPADLNLLPWCLNPPIRNKAAAQWVGEGASLSSETMADYHREHVVCACTQLHMLQGFKLTVQKYGLAIDLE